MKKQKLKLGLNKVNVSNLSNIKGGGPKEVHTLTRLGHICCPVLGTEECPNTQVTTCHGGTSRDCTQQTHCLC